MFFVLIIELYKGVFNIGMQSVRYYSNNWLLLGLSLGVTTEATTERIMMSLENFLNEIGIIVSAQTKQELDECFLTFAKGYYNDPRDENQEVDF